MEEKQLPHNHGGLLAQIYPSLPDDVSIVEGASAFQQLSDPSRLRIFWLLCHCEECGVNLAAALGMSHAAVSHHLKALRLSGLIVGRREGKEIYYTLADTELARLLHRVVDDFFRLSCPTKGLHSHEG